ncbi:MAG: amidohydrolase family protein [Bacteroidota bacterium]
MSKKIFILRVIFIGIFYSAFALGITVNTSATGNQPIALINCTIIDGTGAKPIQNGIIVFEGNTIKAVGKMDRGKNFGDCKVIDLQGATVLPGLVNAHVHNAYYEKHAEIWASSGVTTVRDLSCGRNEVEKAISFRNYARNNPKLCRILSAGSLITVPWGYKANYGITVKSEEDAQAKVQKELDAGVDFVKIVFLEPAFPQLANLSPKLGALIVSLAHERGVPVTAHVGTARDLKTALDCGVDDIAHIVNDQLTDELIQRMVSLKIPLEPTLTNWATSKGSERAIILSNVKRFHEAGGQIALGAEHIPTVKHAGPFVGMPVAELLMMQEAGMSPMQIIVASTLNSAKVCKLDKLLGTLQPGKIADILVLNGNPLADLKVFSNVKMVIRDGVIIRE